MGKADSLIDKQASRATAETEEIFEKLEFKIPQIKRRGAHSKRFKNCNPMNKASEVIAENKRESYDSTEMLKYKHIKEVIDAT